MYPARQKTALVLLLWLLGAVGLSVISVSTVAAQKSALEDIFVVRDVILDERAETAAAARTQALAKGQREAFRRLEARLIRSVHRGLAESVDADTLRFLVDAIQIDDEKTSNVRYLANLTVEFKPDAVRNLFRFLGVPFAELRSRPLTVAPVLARVDRYILWDDPNPWREAWRNDPEGAGLVPMLAPIGDLSDLAGLSVDQAVAGEPEALAQLAARYGARGVLVAIANVFETEPGILRTDVVTVPVGLPEMAPFSISVVGIDGDGEAGLFARAVGEIREVVEDEWKAANAITSSEISRVRAAVPISDLKNWVDVRVRIALVPAVTNVQVVALTATAAEVEIDHRGDLTRLIRSFERFDLILEETGLGPGTTPGTGQPSAETPLTHVIRLAGS
ncbi:MAG: hypothetical protein CMM26_10235 [Rhodospirillaceae bacterium]|nr:hypothetical protein [Rhodospirillaceae bacterium]|tara:strand:- start:482 stop:1657 length:1176 start_codon:yes stop_codon:yes gene_type:complete